MERCRVRWISQAWRRCSKPHQSPTQTAKFWRRVWCMGRLAWQGLAASCPAQPELARSDSQRRETVHRVAITEATREEKPFTTEKRYLWSFQGWANPQMPGVVCCRCHNATPRWEQEPWPDFPLARELCPQPRQGYLQERGGFLNRAPSLYVFLLAAPPSGPIYSEFLFCEVIPPAKRGFDKFRNAGMRARRLGLAFCLWQVGGPCHELVFLVCGEARSSWLLSWRTG